MRSSMIDDQNKLKYLLTKAMDEGNNGNMDTAKMMDWLKRELVSTTQYQEEKAI
ncbi:hypothetical protein [Bacillus sp. 2205SS5-2]|uniref:hypothetical protein n=1 Tax=Bacillus sp. 2205SS5-2 TaxID=3109031 RepID=UPI0030052DD9